MPAKYTKRFDKENSYFHIYNCGISGKNIFNDAKDYEVFLSFLQEYLVPPIHPDSFKKTFTIKGKTYKGVPHLAKNYFGKIDLIVYVLTPTHFHLVLHQKTKESTEKFMRSLCTRYSMYFNKKYKSSGSLFDGPYKSAGLENMSSLLYLSWYLHRKHYRTNENAGDIYSSYDNYLGLKETPWVKTQTILETFAEPKLALTHKAKNYQHFVEKYSPDENETSLFRGITFEDDNIPLERIAPKLARNIPEENITNSAPSGEKNNFFGYASAFVIFVFLFSFGFRNVLISSAKSIVSTESISESISSPAPAVAGVEVEVEAKMLIINIGDGSGKVNIREAPTTQSAKIGEAKNGETYEYTSLEADWYQIKLSDGTMGFVSSRYAEPINTNNEKQ